MSRLILIDGHAILHRAFHAYPPLTTSKGELVGAVYGFTNILLTVLRRLHPEFVAIAFDEKGPTFRHKKFVAYKSHRPAMDEGLSGQIPRVHEVVEALNIPIFEVEGYEADDVIGTLVRQAYLNDKSQRPKVKNLETVIVTGDQDALQLVNNSVKVYLPARGKQPDQVYDKKRIMAKYGVEPKQIVDLKALAGDPSDGIPGVRGIGPKGAAKLIGDFGGIEEVYNNLDKINSEIREKLKVGQENAFLSKELAEINTQVPIKLDLPACRLTNYDKRKVLKLFEELEFTSLIKKLPNDSWEEKDLNIERATPENGRNGKAEDNSEQMGLF